MLKKPPLTPHFSGDLSVEKEGFMYKVKMRIIHIKTKVVVIVNEELFFSERDYLESFDRFLALHQNLFLLKKEYKKAPVSAKVESTTKQQSEVYRCILILSRFYSIYQVKCVSYPKRTRSNPN